MAFDSLSERLNKSMRNIAGKGRLTDKNMEDMLKEVRLSLLEADVNYKVVKQFLDTVREKARGKDVLNNVDPGQMLVKIVHDEIINLLGTEQAGINFKEHGTTILMMVGLQGTGKTTSAAKIAKICQEKMGKKCLLVAADVIRPAAIEQLQTLGKEIGTEVFSKGPSVSAADTVKAALAYNETEKFDLMILDTAGRLHVDEELMNELVEINDLVHADDILLTVDAMTGQDIVHVAQSFKDRLPVTGLVVTKFDGDSRGGGVLSVKAITDVPVKFVGEGEKLEDMDIFYPDRMADRILGMGDVVTLVEKAQEKMDLEAAEKSAKRMLNGEFTMDDMLTQFEQIRKMGPLGSIMKMIPGYSQYSDMIDEAKASDSMKVSRAIIQSMTLAERADPESIRSSMKRRIAAGSGTQVTDVNKIINQFLKMKKTMDQVSMMSKSGMMNEETLQKMMDNAQNPQPQKVKYRYGNKGKYKF